MRNVCKTRVHCILALAYALTGHNLEQTVLMYARLHIPVAVYSSAKCAVISITLEAHATPKRTHARLLFPVWCTKCLICWRSGVRESVGFTLSI